MAHFAELNDENIVLRVIVIADNDCEDLDGTESEAVGIAFCKFLYGDDTNWVQTSYSSRMRGQYAGIGDTYDSVKDIFISPKPFPSWIWNDVDNTWTAPIPMPLDQGFSSEIENLYIAYSWNEETQQWDRFEHTLQIIT